MRSRTVSTATATTHPRVEDRVCTGMDTGFPPTTVYTRQRSKPDTSRPATRMLRKALAHTAPSCIYTARQP